MRLLVCLFAACAATACVAPPPPRAPAPNPPAIVALPPPAPVDWHDAPVTPGTWRYLADSQGTVARFGIDGAAALFAIRCEPGGTIALLGQGVAGTAVITTSQGTRRFAAGMMGGAAGWRLAARDPVLDEIAFSRGRFMVEGLGPRLILPAWAQPARVIEDCRG